MSASDAMRSNKARRCGSAMVSPPNSTKAAWTSCGGTAVPIRFNQAWVTGGPFWFSHDVGRQARCARVPVKDAFAVSYIPPDRLLSGNRLGIDRQPHRRIARSIRVQLVARTAGRGIGLEFHLQFTGLRIGGDRIEVDHPIENARRTDELVVGAPLLIDRRG